MKILIVRFSSIGDIVLTTPIIRCLKKQLSNCEIHYLTKKSFVDVIKANPYIDKIHLLDSDLNITISKLEAENYNLVIDLHKNLRTLLLKFRLQTIAFSYRKLNFKKWLITNFKINILPEKHIVDRYFETIKSLGVENDQLGLDYFIPVEDNISIDQFPLTHLHGYVGLVLGAAHYTKRIPIEKLESICEQLQVPIILVGGPSEKEESQILTAKFPLKIFNTCGLLNINQSASIIKQAKLVITPDTGMMHIAAAFKKKIISVWGNTIPEFGMYPYFGKTENLKKKESLPFTIIEQKLKCRPCSKIGHNSCPKGHFKCMKSLNIEQIIENI